MKKKIILVAVLFLSSIIFNIQPKQSIAASPYSFEQGDQYMSGAYDKQSESPTPYNWTRNSQFYSVESNPTLKWELTFKDQVRGNPTIGSDGTIYVPSSYGFINAVNNDGTLKWRVSRNGSTDHLMGLTAVIGEDGTLFAGNQAFNPDGTLKWVHGKDHIRNKTIAIDADGNIYYTGLQNLYSLDSNGNLNWSYRISTANIDNISSPSIGTDGTIYIALGPKTEKPGILAINPDGTVKWQLEVDSKNAFISPYGGFGSIAIGKDGTLYFGLATKTIYAVNPDGTVKWTYKTTEEIQTGVTIGIDGSIIFGSRDRSIYALNEDGTLNWNYKLLTFPAVSPIVDKNGNIFIQYGRYIDAITPTGEHLWKYDLQSHTNSGSLAIGKDGTIYAVNGTKLTAITGDIYKDFNYCDIYTDLKNTSDEDLNTQEKIDKARQELNKLQSELDKIKNKIDNAESNL